MQHVYHQLFESRYSHMQNIGTQCWVATLDPEARICEGHITRTLGRVFIVARLARPKKFTKTELHDTKRLLDQHGVGLYHGPGGSYYVVYDYILPDSLFFAMKNEMIGQKTAAAAVGVYDRHKTDTHMRAKEYVIAAAAGEQVAEFVLVVPLDDFVAMSNTELLRTYNATALPVYIQKSRGMVCAVAYGETAIGMHCVWDPPMLQHESKWTTIVIQH